MLLLTLLLLLSKSITIVDDSLFVDTFGLLATSRLENCTLTEPRGVALSLLVELSFVSNSTGDIMSMTSTFGALNPFFFAFAFFAGMTVALVAFFLLSLSFFSS